MKRTVIVTVYSCLLACCFVTQAHGQTASKKIPIKKEQRYLNFPIEDSAALKKTRIVIDGKTVDEFTIRLADGTPDYWTFFDVSRYGGKTITVESETSAEASLNKIVADTKFPGQDSVYKEPLRPQVHFSSRRGWHNDPNGLIFYNGEYHLFYQHNPFGWSWGNMHWGHAVSADLLHWSELPDALYTPRHEDMAFSGSAVTDTANTSGFRKGGVDPLIAVFTSTGRGECLALSYDNGRTFQDYAGNPVVKHKGRDPKVFWYSPGKHWVMVVYDESHSRAISMGLKAMNYEFSIYTSPDLKTWTYQSSLPNFFECPELFQLPIQGEADKKKWIIYAADGKYKVGDFDGKTFTIEQDFRTYDHGGAFYASQTYNHIPATDGRRIQIGWARIPLENMPFNQCMTFPTELYLKKAFDGYRLCPKPVRELKTLYKTNAVYNDLVLNKEKPNVTASASGDVLHVIAEFERGDSREFGLNINGYELNYNNLFNEFNKLNYPVSPDSLLKIEVIVDKAIAEVFVNDGELYFVKQYNSVNAEKSLNVFAKGVEDGRKTILRRLEVHELKPVWTKTE